MSHFAGMITIFMRKVIFITESIVDNEILTVLFSTKNRDLLRRL